MTSSYQRTRAAVIEAMEANPLPLALAWQIERTGFPNPLCETEYELSFNRRLSNEEMALLTEYVQRFISAINKEPK